MEKTIRRAVKATAKTSIAGNRGFTLLELIVVLFIIGLSTSVVVFSIGRLHDKTVFNGESRR
ncbi:MAG: prepilin-type N-terminal cleavage/methylation domain-containing protein, partial [Nitrospirota bacterium]|nr:prepilin-type N-terminal cleavage/methylation domain-containing protein [Nitrospirota bacterium]